MPATQREKDFAESIEIHHDRLIRQINLIIDRFKESKNDQNRDWVNAQIDYYKRVRAGLKWSTSVAKQKAGKK